MAHRTRATAGLFLAALILVPAARSQRLSGSIAGRVEDAGGRPLPGASVYLVSPAIASLRTYITGRDGRFAFLALPPGTYKLTAEMPGFKSLEFAGLAVRPGRAVTVPARLEPSEVEETVPGRLPAPMVDRASARASFILEDPVRRLPLPRDVSGLLDLLPSAVAVESFDAPYMIAFGAAARDNAFRLDGLDLTDPVTRAPVVRIDPEVVAEVVMDYGGAGADAPPVSGNVVDVIVREGGNAFNGSVAGYYTGESLSKAFALAPGAPSQAIDRSLYDLSVDLGGPLWESRAWYYTNLRYLDRRRAAPFAAGRDPFGGLHLPFDLASRTADGLLKLTVQATPEARAYVSAGLQDRDEPYFEGDLAVRRPDTSTRSLDHARFFYLNGGVNYVIDRDTVLEGRAAYATSKRPLLLTAATNSPRYVDAASGWTWGSAPYNEQRVSRIFQGRVNLSRYVSSFLGAEHELAAGAEYETATADWSTWKLDNLELYTDGASRYFYGDAVSPKSGKTVGRGLIGFYLAAKEMGGLDDRSGRRRLSAFLQDSVGIADRLHLTLGLRFDHSKVDIVRLSKTVSGNAASVAAGKAVVLPVVGINPFDAAIVAAPQDFISWNTLSPRAGLAFDLFGSGRTVLTASWSRLAELPSLLWAQAAAPLSPGGLLTFGWYDENANGAVDATDTFTAGPDDYRALLQQYASQRVSADLRQPSTTVWTAGLRQQLRPDVSLSVDGLLRNQSDLVQSVLYDVTSGRTWSTLEESPSGWWVPFRTLVPGEDGNVPLTVYVPSTTAPSFFHQLQNVSGTSRRYRGLAFTLEKAMTDWWQADATLVLSRTTGLLSLGPDASSGVSLAAATPNFGVNRSAGDRLPEDRPLVFKLHGTVRLPWAAYLSLVYTGWTGTPGERTVTVVPPADWAAAAGARVVPALVRLSALTGGDRGKSYGRLDLRLEKGLRLRGARLDVTLDAFNLLGQKWGVFDLNPDGTWYPLAEGVAEGTRVVDPAWKTWTAARNRLWVQLGVRIGL